MSPPRTRGSGPALAGAEPAPNAASRHHDARHQDRSGSGRLDDPELLAEVYRLVRMVIVGSIRRGCKIPGVGTPTWWAAPDDAKIAGLLVLSEAWCVCDPERMVRERLREMSYDLSEAHDWTAASRRTSHATLAARRAEHGPQMPSFDPVAAARWVATGSSEGGAA